MFDQGKANSILELLAQGIPVSQVARQLQMGRRTIHDWREQNPEFAAQFARAKDLGYDAIADSIMEIADDEENDWCLTKKGVVVCDETAIGRARLRVDARLKLLAKWDPKRYGDRVQHDVDAKVHVTVDDPTLRATAVLLPSQAILPKPDDE